MFFKAISPLCEIGVTPFLLSAPHLSKEKQTVRYCCIAATRVFTFIFKKFYSLPTLFLTLHHPKRPVS